MNPDNDGVPMNPRAYNRALDAWAWEVWRVRVRCPYKKVPQHHRKRGYRRALAAVLRHVEAACGYDDALWLYYHIADLRRQADVHRKDNELMLRVLAKERQELWDLRDKLAAWDAWEHAWVFGGEAEYPGSPGVTDPRETLDALVRMAVVMRIEEADDA